MLLGNRRRRKRNWARLRDEGSEAPLYSSIQYAQLKQREFLVLGFRFVCRQTIRARELCIGFSVYVTSAWILFSLAVLLLCSVEVRSSSNRQVRPCRVLSYLKAIPRPGPLFQARYTCDSANQTTATGSGCYPKSPALLKAAPFTS